MGIHGETKGIMIWFNEVQQRVALIYDVFLTYSLVCWMYTFDIGQRKLLSLSQRIVIFQFNLILYILVVNGQFTALCYLRYNYFGTEQCVLVLPDNRAKRHSVLTGALHENDDRLPTGIVPNWIQIILTYFISVPRSMLHLEIEMNSGWLAGFSDFFNRKPHSKTFIYVYCIYI